MTMTTAKRMKSTTWRPSIPRLSWDHATFRGKTDFSTGSLHGKSDIDKNRESTFYGPRPVDQVGYQRVDLSGEVVFSPDALPHRRRCVLGVSLSYLGRGFITKRGHWVGFFGCSNKAANVVRDSYLQPKSWPDLCAYFRLLAKYNIRHLTFDCDILPAFAGISNTLRPSFPGGFLFGMPEIFLDIALLWRPVGPSETRI